MSFDLMNELARSVLETYGIEPIFNDYIYFHPTFTTINCSIDLQALEAVTIAFRTCNEFRELPFDEQTNIENNLRRIYEKSDRANKDNENNFTFSKDEIIDSIDKAIKNNE